jgi:AraC family transcriptional activator of pobA
MKSNTLAAFYDALAPSPESAGGVMPPPDMGQGVGHFNVFSLADLRGTPPMTFSQFV